MTAAPCAIPASATGRIPGLDGLRALACLAVFGVHWQQITGVSLTLGPFDLRQWLENGNCGVALFFMLSAFHLASPFLTSTAAPPSLLSQQASAALPLRALGYLLRRAVRIMPAYYLCLAVLAWNQQLLSTSAGRQDLLRHVAFIHNLWEESFYSIASPFWTIAVQAQFYLLLPLLAATIGLLARRIAPTRAASAWAILWLLLALATYALHYAIMQSATSDTTSHQLAQLVRQRPTVFSHSLLAHSPHFALGAALAGLWFARPAAQSTPTLPAVASELTVWTAALAIPLILATSLDTQLQIPHGRYNLPYIPFLLAILILLTPRSPCFGKIMEAWPLRRLGEISYGVYVFHLPCLRGSLRLLSGSEAATANPSPVPAWQVALLGLILTILVAGCSYLLWERPLLKLIPSFTRSRPSTDTPSSTAPRVAP